MMKRERSYAHRIVNRGVRRRPTGRLNRKLLGYSYRLPICSYRARLRS